MEIALSNKKFQFVLALRPAFVCCIEILLSLQGQKQK